ncbi:hypothetical protein ACFV1C_00455 [Streptomyces sp. NPDC059605]|uniref:hypothetical protein n=1 Tax=Streptomyces sp. NPDC059605 TaxID=3346882 RepID=UPI0036C1B56D
MPDLRAAGSFVVTCGAGLISIAAAMIAARLRGSTSPAARHARPPADVLALVEDGRADGLDFYHCPAEGRRRPHAVGVDGSRACWTCGHHTPGDHHA